MTRNTLTYLVYPEVSDQDTIRQVYDKYVEFYRRPPVYPDHLRKFANKFQGIHVTFAAAKSYLDTIRATNESQQFMFGTRSSLSSPGLVQSDDDKSEQIPISPLISLIDDGNDADKDDDDYDDNNNEDEEMNEFSFYNMTDFELLQRIKKKICSALENDSDDIATTIHMIWQFEYSELEKRLHRAYLHKPYDHYNNNKMPTLKRDKTFLSLKNMSESTDVDDQDHDAAVYLLKTYFPDDDEDDIPSFKSPKSSKSASHASQKSALSPNKSRNRLKTRTTTSPHQRSMTADKERKPASYRRPTAQTEALSLYDTMVMKARESKNNDAPSISKYKSAPTVNHKHNKLTLSPSDKPRLETIPSQNDSDDDSLSVSTHHHQQQILYKLDDNEMEIKAAELTPEPPLFDPAFRQLTTVTNSVSITDDVPMETSIDIGSTASISLYDDDDGDEKEKEYVIPPNLLDIMSKYGNKMESWDFDVFEFMDDPSFCGKGLVFASFFLFRKIGLLDATGITQANLWRFLENVQLGYKNNPYHNTYHSVDVLLSTHYMFQSSFFRQNMTIWDQFGAYIAAVCHDLGHMGMNNGWYVNTAGNLALLYGDESVLENYHIAETFRILNDHKNNWMLSFPSSVRRYLATVIRRSILATDLKVHGTKMIQLQNMVDTYKAQIKSKVNDNNNQQTQHELIANHIKLWRCESIANYASLDNIMLDDFRLFMDDKLNQEWTRDAVIKDLDIDDHSDCDDDDDSILPKRPRILGVDDERIFLLEITIHACDVANPCKPLFLAKQWANRYLVEAFNQGDQERDIGIPVSAGMDRFTSKLPTSQIGFITFVVKRLFELYSEIIDVSNHPKKILLQNEQYWIEEKKKMIANKQQNKASKQKPPSNLGTINE